MHDEAASAQDFYEQVNGPWLEKTSIPPSAGIIDTFREAGLHVESQLHQALAVAVARPNDQLSRVLGEYYAAGLDQAGRDRSARRPIRDLLDSIRQADTIEAVLVALGSLHTADVGAVWRIVAAPERTPDADVRARARAWVVPGQLGLGDPSAYEIHDDRDADIRDRYTLYIEAQLRNGGMPSATAAAEAPDVLAFERLLANLMSERRAGVPEVVEMSPLDVEQLAQETGVSLAKYVGQLGTRADYLGVLHVDYLREACAALRSTRVETLQAYVTFLLVHRFSDCLHSAASDAHHAMFGMLLRGRTSPLRVKDHVLAAMQVDLGDALSRFYVRDFVQPDVVVAARSLAGTIVDEMRASIETRPWIGRRSRERAWERLDSLDVRIGHPDEWPPPPHSPVAGEDFGHHRVRAAVGRTNATLDQQKRQSADRWQAGAFTVSACYHPDHHVIEVPAGLLTPPFFDPTADPASNFGALGFVIGHELTHAMGAVGSHGEGHFPKWLAEEDRERYDGLLASLAVQYSDYYSGGIAIDGQRTLWENVADLGGVALAFRAMERSAESNGRERTCEARQFFRTFARVMRGKVTPELQRTLTRTSPYSPHEWRVRGPLGNFTPFAEAFGLADDDPAMRPRVQRVEIW